MKHFIQSDMFWFALYMFKLKYLLYSFRFNSNIWVSGDDIRKRNFLKYLSHIKEGLP